ncbi:MAG: hypothetical protein C0493_02350 [Kytococcus sp.]|nr:hypothetical protein [Kytococcus sp.]
MSVRSRFRLDRAGSVRLVSALLLLLLAVVVFGNSWGVFQTDIKPEVYLAPQEMLPRYLSAWTSSPYLGSPNFNVGLVPVLVVTAALRAVGLDPEMAFKVYHLLLWALAAWGTNRLLRTLVPGAGAWAGLLAGVAYIANPYAVAAGGTLAIALPMALLPWLLIAMTKALREPTSWAWPAAVGLVFFCMSGMNVGVVPVYQLLLVIPLVLHVRSEQGLTWAEVLTALAKSALFVVLVSAYWLVPGAAASDTGSQIVQGSESLDGIARVSSFVEVLRGLGLWSYYGSSDAGPWIPQYAMYLTSAVIVLLTMLWPAAALASLRVVPARLARFSALGTAIVAVIMVGLYPGGNGSSAFSIVLRWLFEHLTPLVAFRTTNKVGAGLALVFALVIGLGLVRLLPRVLRRNGGVPLVATLATGVVVALVAPAVTGNLYVSPLDVPDYWKRAAAAADEGDANGRVLLLPGQTRSSYRWSLERPDDLPNSLMQRDAVIPETIPNTSATGGNFLAALDATLQQGTAGSHEVSPFARYLGADRVLLRHDVNWEDTGGARPGETARALGGDPGLRGLANFGAPGQNMFTYAVPPVSQDEAVLSPLQLYGVRGHRGVVRATPTPGTVVVAGDAWAIPPLAEQGLLDDTPALRYAHDVTDEQLREVLRDGGRMVLTDTNQRRAAITNRLTANQGAVLAADETPALTRALGDAQDQSTLVRDGVRATATSSGGAFFDLPHGVAEHAIDGDRRTSWLFGDFQRAKGESITLRLPRERQLGRVRIDTTALGGVEIDSLRVDAGESTRTAKVEEDGTAEVQLGGITTDRVRITVAGLRGEGFSLVGLSEIDLGAEGLVAERTVRTPDTLSRLYSGLDARERSEFGQTPLDVSFTRVVNTDAPTDDSEQGLRRDFTLPDDREVRMEARVRATGDLEHLADELSGAADTYRMRSNRTYFDALDVRASKAADDDPRTAWVPGGDLADAWWEVTGPQRDLDRVAITQAPGPDDEGDTMWATRARVLVDGEEVADARIGRGSTTTITLPPRTSGRTLRVAVDEVDDSDGNRPPRFTSIDTGVELEQGEQSRPCIPVATIDGDPVRMRPSDPEAIAGRDGPATTWQGCAAQSITWGEHRLRPVDDIQLDGLTLRDRQGTKPTETVPPPVVEVDRTTLSASMTVSVGAARTPYFLTIGEGHDPRWRATLEDGTDLGPPVVVDGYAAGWYVDDLAAHEVSIGYGPQRRADVALLVSGLSLLVALVLLLTPLVRRRVAAVRTERETEWPEEPLVDPAAAETAAPAEQAAVPEPVVARDPLPFVGLGRVLADRSGRSRVLVEVGIVLGAFVLTGIGGSLGALAAMLLVRRQGPRPGRLIAAGAALVVLSAAAYLVQAGLVEGTLGSVDADTIKASLVPHHLAGAGVVLAVLGTFMRPDPPKESTT